ncbi:hypothetical protein D0867_13290 [Hortaea werneckii]|uniref:BZIP domain-containing protein n=1 Tax=Hortaea werneckii TaxID=91943 RepID=A0A3M6XZ18_HORWE|nr:hypothetical protein D0867_13290 [Hortaea werneckii]RMY26302.1 hypothetical protein D0866_10883 [Hortaea werneckii]
MTCVIASTWHPFTDSTSWSPMNPDVQTYHYGLERQTSQGYTSSGSESRKPLGKKRASRAGTRSVSTLSAAQLERKRANDREAQRAIRQRTKDHIESLEKEIGDLRESNESREKLVTTTQQRNRELEDENRYLRTKLNEAGFAVPPPEQHRQSDAPLLSVPDSSLHRPSPSSPRSMSLAPSHSSGSRHGSFHQQNPYHSAVPGSTVPVNQSNVPVGSQHLPGWRPQDGAQSMPNTHSVPMQTSLQHHPPMAWAPSGQAYQYGAQEQPAIKYEHPPTQPSAVAPHAYGQPSAPTYAAAPAPQAQSYQAPHMPPQNEFQAMAVSSPSTYQVASQQAPPHLSHQQPYHTPQAQHAYAQGYAQQPAYQIPSVQVPPPSAEYPTSESQLPPAPLPHPTYGQPSHEHQQYASQPPATTQAQVSYREDSRGYPLSHYPTA